MDGAMETKVKLRRETGFYVPLYLKKKKKKAELNVAVKMKFTSCT